MVTNDDDDEDNVGLSSGPQDRRRPTWPFWPWDVGAPLTVLMWPVRVPGPL